MTVTLSAGTRLGVYEIVAPIGAGGMGEVYRARDTQLDRDVAIKVLPEGIAKDPVALSRFEREAKAVAALSHPNIVGIHGFGTEDGTAYAVMELLAGETLRECLRVGQLPLRKAVEHAVEVAQGLAAAHAKGIVHRDLKPENIFITRDARVKILDFGLARYAPLVAGDGTDSPTETRHTELGSVLGTVGYMSPEQVQGKTADHRSDIFSFGCVLYEMLSGRRAFQRETTAETMTAILREDAPEMAGSQPAPSTALERIVRHCLEKNPEERFQSARDLAFDLQSLSGSVVADATSVAAARSRPRLGPILGVLALSLVAGVAGWLTRGTSSPPSIDNPLANAQFTRFTDFEGSEVDAAISPDGRFVAFIADRDGPFHVWLSQVGTGRSVNLTPGTDDQKSGVRSVGFSADGSEIWLGGAPDRRLRLMPLTGGTPRVFLGEHVSSVAWSPDGTRLVYHTRDAGDPMFVADANGANARQIFVAEPGEHNHYPVWSSDGRWIYFVHGIPQTLEMDLQRIPASGGVPERLTEHNVDVAYPTPIDARTVLYVARAEDRSGPWLWALDVERRVTRRVSFGLERYLSVSASADGRRLVTTVANPTASLWSVPILDRIADEGDVKPLPMPTVRAWAPRFGGASLFYLSSRGTGDGLWRLDGEQAFEIWKGSHGALLEPPAVSPDGRRAAVVLREQGTLHLNLVSTDGAEQQPLAEVIDVRGTSAWSPDANWIVTGGTDAQGPGLFKIPVDGGAPVRLTAGPAFNPVWSPDGSVIVYAGEQVAQSTSLFAVRPDGSALRPSPIGVSSAGQSYRFLPDAKGLVYRQGTSWSEDFWLLDLITNETRQLARLSNPAITLTFDVSPDGSRIVFDRLRENSDVVLIDLPGP